MVGQAPQAVTLLLQLVLAMPTGQVTPQFPVEVQVTAQVPRQVTLQLIAELQLALLPPPRTKVQVAMLLHDTVDELPAWTSQSLSELQEAVQRLPQLVLQVLVLLHEALQPSPQACSQRVPPLQEHWLPAQTQAPARSPVHCAPEQAVSPADRTRAAS